MGTDEKTLIIGLGNTLLTDRGVGIYVLRRLRNVLQSHEITFEESDSAGLNLVAMVDGFDRVIIVDSINTPTGVPGNVYRFRIRGNEDSQPFPGTIHMDTDLLKNRTKVGNIYMPSRVVVYAVEVKDFSSFGKGCTVEVEKAIPRVVNLVMEEMNARLATS